MSGPILITVVAVLAVAGVIAAVFVVRTRRVVATPTERAVHAALHTASQAARALREGLDRIRRARPLRICAHSPASRASSCSTVTAGCWCVIRPTIGSGDRRSSPPANARPKSRLPVSDGC